MYEGPTGGDGRSSSTRVESKKKKRAALRLTSCCTEFERPPNAVFLVLLVLFFGWIISVSNGRVGEERAKNQKLFIEFKFDSATETSIPSPDVIVRAF